MQSSWISQRLGWATVNALPEDIQCLLESGLAQTKSVREQALIFIFYSFKSIALVLYDSFMCYLHTVGDFLPVREDLCQVLCTQHVPQGGLCQQTSGCISIGDVGYCQRCVLNTVVDYTIYTHGHRVLCQHLSGWMHKDYLIKNIIWVIKTTTTTTTTTRKRKHKHTLLVKNYNIHFFFWIFLFFTFSL